MDENAEQPPSDPALDDRLDEHGAQNEIGYRSVDEEAAYDERGGTQGPGRGDPPADEESPGD